MWRDNRGAFAVWFSGDQAADGPCYLNERNAVDLSWSVEAIGDFNHDKNVDLLWRRNDGKLNIWLLAGITFRKDIDLHPGVTPEWQIFGPLRD